jgi:prepilin-type N-terminal cleavage/methylation domain-containing protein
MPPIQGRLPCPCPWAQRRRAFTLLELVIVVAILAILAGAAVPMASKFFNSRARAATREELAELSDAAVEYFRDTGSLPTGVESLLADPGQSGWAGPYVSVSGSEPWSGATDVQVDAWARNYVFQIQGASLLELRSAGEDGELGDATDILFTVDVTPVRREETLAQLATLNGAIVRYNAQYLPDDPLSSQYTVLLARLVATGFLPASEPFEVDRWGSSFVADPPNKTPVVAVASVNLAGSSSGSGEGTGEREGGASDSGNGKKEKDQDQGNGKGNGKGKGKGNGKKDKN